MKEPLICFYDLETSPVLAYCWGPGEQIIRHSQLHKDHKLWGIICATYCFNDGKPAKSIDWGYKEQDTEKVVREFDKIIAKADVVIGKNNKRFDDKMLNTMRMVNGLPPMPRWATKTDDLETQMRRQFRLPSQALDYVSDLLGYGGKHKMEMKDWIDIVEQNKGGKAALAKMVAYGKKDVEDTRSIWYRVYDYLDNPRFNMNTFLNQKQGCRHCGSTDVRSAGQTPVAGTLYQRWRCNNCNREAGRNPVNKDGEAKGRLK